MKLDRYMNIPVHTHLQVEQAFKNKDSFKNIMCMNIHIYSI